MKHEMNSIDVVKLVAKCIRWFSNIAKTMPVDDRKDVVKDLEELYTALLVPLCNSKESLVKLFKAFPDIPGALKDVAGRARAQKIIGKIANEIENKNSDEHNEEDEDELY